MSALLRFNGRVTDLTAAERRCLFDRSTSADASIRQTTAAIIDDVRERGDAALYDLARRFDGATLSALDVSRAEMRRALDALAPELRRAMERTIRNIASVHSASLPSTITSTPEPGVTVCRRPDPLARVGVYAPGGRAAYPSSVLMAAVPARVAGVGDVIVCSPPDASGRPSSLVMAGAGLAGGGRLFALGGAGAIAAMALGTASVPRVDRIVGPGNAYVAEAKLQLCGAVGIDSPAGPSELLVVADAEASPSTIAREMLAQAEHDPLACVVAVVVGGAAANAVAAAIEATIACQPRAAIIREALAGRGGVLSVSSQSDAIDFANSYAPEHLLVVARDADAIVASIRNAGTVFVGATSSVAFGDYMTGANHVLPTGGLARSYSGLSVLDFLRWTTIQRVTPEAARSLSGDVASFADAEGLPGHALAARGA